MRRVLLDDFQSFRESESTTTPTFTEIKKSRLSCNPRPHLIDETLRAYDAELSRGRTDRVWFILFCKIWFIDVMDGLNLEFDESVPMDDSMEPGEGEAINGADEPNDGEENGEETEMDDYDVEGDDLQSEADGIALSNGNSPKPRLQRIEVILPLPLDRNSFRALPPSWEVAKVLDEIDTAEDENWYSVEFDDARVDQVAYDDLLALEHGRAALERFHRDRDFGLEQAAMPRTSSKRRWYDDSDSDNRQYSRGHARATIPLRRSSRQKTTWRHTSEVDSGVDEDLEGINLDEDDSDHKPKTSRSQKQGLGSNKRTTRSQNASTKKYVLPRSSEDELANSEDDGDAFIPVTSDLVVPGRSARKKRGKVRYSQKFSHSNDRESSIEFETSTRKSGRTTKKTSYRMPDAEDEFEAVDEKASSMPKHVSVREIFQPPSGNSEFEKMHASTCETCQGGPHIGKGPLIYCQGCSYSFHKICLGQRSVRDHRVTKIGPDNFVLQCRICIGIYQRKDAHAPNHAICQTCKLDGASCAEFSAKRTTKYEEKLRHENGGEDPITEVDTNLIDNADSLLFRCNSCKRGYHFEHLPPLNQHDEVSDDLRTVRLEEYSMAGWRCKDCVESEYKIHALIAWRPVDQQSYIAGTTCLDVSEDQKQFLVKWETRSHFHDTWMPGAWIFGTAASSMRSSFYKREANMLPKMTAADAVDEEWLLADVFLKVEYRRNTQSSSKAKDLARWSDVKEVFVKFQGLSYTETVWDTPPPRDAGAAWDAFRAAYEEYVNGVHFPSVPNNKMAERIKQFHTLDFSAECELKTQPKGLKRGELMEYQLEGVNWLLFNFHKKQNVILADEMGLGKTVQVVTLITTLVQDKPNCWPFLIVVPNSTCPNWRRELKHWAPDLRVVTYHGGKAAQDLAFRHELFPDGIKAGMKAHVVIMSYEAAVEAKTAFQSVKWAGLVVDEGQRLKNENSLLYLALQDMRIPFRLLLTGTPLQNNKRELFNLLQFIDSSNIAEELDEKYAELTKENMPELHQLIRPYFLRRTKAQVLKFLPPMAQIILPVTMTILQEKLSKSIIARNPELIKAIISKGKVKPGERKGLNNILMALRRILCHPFIFSDSVEDRMITDPAKVQQNLVEASGKLMLLNIMLPKLKERGHRVLIFSQFLMSLTILEDFLTTLGLQHARIDGALSALEKQKRIDAFNAPESPLFAMLLSTRAGGVGINLATADTVIIYDPDFNPHQDIQALSRAHRIGQKDKVLCFQMTTKDTVEEKIMQIGRKKMALDHALIESMDADEDAGDDLESILKHGAETLFSGDARAKIVYDDASVNKLIDRSQMESTSTGDDKSAETQFSFARVWANDEGTLTATADDDANDDSAKADHSVWENILRQRQEEHERELAAKQQEYGRGARRRNQDVRYDRPHDQDGADSDTDNEDEYNGAGNSEVDSEPEEEQSGGSAKGKGVKVLESDLVPLPRRLSSPSKSPVPRRKGRPRKERPEETLDQAHRKPRARPYQAPVQRGPKPLELDQIISHTRPQDKQFPPSRPDLQQPVQWTKMPQTTQQSHRQNSTSLPQTSVPPPQPPRSANPMLMVSNPGLEQRRQSIPQWQNIPDRTQQLPQAQYLSNPHINSSVPPPSRMTLKSHITDATQGVSVVPNGSAKNQPNGARNSCFVCQGNHISLSCVDMNSEISLRIAIDSLRTSKTDPVLVERAREFLQQRLRSFTKR
ncbi:chromo domain-containing protein [Xylariales sp. AK1849]|nr:chromo domain-containing protein [Xylariales sp. AK1849]